MTNRPEFLQNSIIIAAHPDDEMLWFGAVLHQVDKVLLVFEDFWPDPSIGAVRSKALSNFPRPNVSSLKIPEAATYGCADWQNPKLSPYGIELRSVTELRDLKQTLLRAVGKGSPASKRIRSTYRDNFERLVRELRPQLSPETNVFTHNPWGEYGHEDHVQVFRAVDFLRKEIGFKLWISNYCSERALPLATTYFDDREKDAVHLPVNKPFCEEVAQVYRDAGCWTWSDTWKWFDYEFYMQAPTEQSNPKTQGKLFPLNMFNIEPV
ncbi:hypothetical protein SAMN05877838_0536 [Hoeflea halophila]|uniref:GlcNAc-PI de-N-acetylase n=2 Tax=Hoeflea halophila TaxID=714899 RepID=A0A286HMU5_9HYPH|nr:hypothetical protein SAMN05877838_0536 [Hoeflea halophila]